MGLFGRDQKDLEYPEIITLCLKGDRKAQKALFEQFAPKMLGLCRRYAVDDQEAQDMAQEGFIRLFNNLEKFRNTGPFEGWVRRIFVNTAIKYYHRQKTHHSATPAETAFDLEHRDVPVLDMLSEQELLRMLDTLPEGYKVVFNLYAIEGFSHAEIAELLNIQESTSRSQLVKARKMLQTKVNELQRILI